ncbi:hypothetical protein E8E12_002508 [Didymella heteroderae]|uniref:Uncharacterized protein n=1 Tax=Didymella heteroderae TaxID=1769908 RepID=A0A9P4WPN2_9PLEO|nr:hypothetical protein E8E12_002508 [Didymella heteroderae]
MVFISSRAVDSTCESDFHSIEAVPAAAVEACQREATMPYCWPPNGSRICSPDNKVEFYWPPGYYNDSETSHLSILSNGIEIKQADRAGSGRLNTYLDPRDFGLSEQTPGRTNERAVNITITERRMANDSWGEYSDYIWFHQGPILILVSSSAPSATPSSTTRARLFGTPTSTPTATVSAIPDGRSDFTPGEIAGIGIGAFCGLVLLTALAYHCCAQCCITCCYPGEAERRRVKAAERRRIQQEREYAQPDVDAIKAAVARGEVWQGPVRPGGMWVSRSDWPAAPRRAARPVSRGEDEIWAVDVNEEIWMVEQRSELQRIEEQRREEQRVAERREELARTEEGEPPAYEAPPPKYTP